MKLIGPLGYLMNNFIPDDAIFKIGDAVKKRSGGEWAGKVVGYYCTTLTPVGYCVESKYHAGSVQIYPEKALEPDDVQQ
jgi:hypothetical protein